MLGYVRCKFGNFVAIREFFVNFSPFCFRCYVFVGGAPIAIGVQATIFYE